MIWINLSKKFHIINFFKVILTPTSIPFFNLKVAKEYLALVNKPFCPVINSNAKTMGISRLLSVMALLELIFITIDGDNFNSLGGIYGVLAKISSNI